jgi:hypothetical protein
MPSWSINMSFIVLYFSAACASVHMTTAVASPRCASHARIDVFAHLPQQQCGSLGSRHLLVPLM